MRCIQTDIRWLFFSFSSLQKFFNVDWKALLALMIVSCKACEIFTLFYVSFDTFCNRKFIQALYGLIHINLKPTSSYGIKVSSSDGKMSRFKGMTLPTLYRKNRDQKVTKSNFEITISDSKAKNLLIRQYRLFDQYKIEWCLCSANSKFNF